MRSIEHKHKKVICLHEENSSSSQHKAPKVRKNNAAVSTRAAAAYDFVPIQ
jgi:hypothetical protein